MQVPAVTSYRSFAEDLYDVNLGTPIQDHPVHRALRLRDRYAPGGDRRVDVPADELPVDKDYALAQSGGGGQFDLTFIQTCEPMRTPASPCAWSAN